MDCSRSYDHQLLWLNDPLFRMINGLAVYLLILPSFVQSDSAPHVLRKVELRVFSEITLSC